MDRYRAVIEYNVKNQSIPLPLAQALQEFLRNGDEKSLETLKAQRNNIYPHEFYSALPRPGEFDEQDARAVRFLLGVERENQLDGWVMKQLGEAAPEAEVFPAIAARLRAAGADEKQIGGLAVQSLCRHPQPATPNSAGRYLLAMDDKTLKGLIITDNYSGLGGLVTLLAQHAPQRIDAMLPALAEELGEGSVAHTLLETAPDRFEDLAAAILRRTEDTSGKLELGKLLLARNPAKYGPEVARMADKVMEHAYGQEALWLLPALGPAVAESIARHVPGWYESMQREVIDLIAKHGGEKRNAALLLIVNSESASAALKAQALNHLIDAKDASLMPHIEGALYKALEGDPRTATKFANAAARSGIEAFRERLWSDVAGKKKLLRAAAAEALAAHDPGALDRAAEMMTAKAKDTRWGAALILAHLATPQAADVLLNRIPRETDEEVRHEMTKAVRNAGVSLDAIVKALGPIDIDKMRERGRQMKGMPVQWLTDDELPAMKMRDGEAVDRDLVRFLLHRQAWQGEAVPDPEAAPLYMLIDRHTSGDFALALLSAFLESGRGKPDAWALIAAGMLGDNRVITTLASKIRTWADGNEQKLGQFGVEALALNGSEAGLMAVQSIADKFRDNPRRKFNVIGSAAQEALELAAKRMGLSMDELGDRIVPSLGFEPGKPRIIEAGGRTIEASIGLDFKLSMKDAKTGKKAISIPKAAPPEVQAEFKGLGKLLVEVAKSQSARLEALMVRQHRWPAARWEEVFLRHPILFPFAVRLVWGSYDCSGKVVSTFRALPDRTLTDSHDEPVELDRNLVVGIVHPLDLTAEQIDAWQTHLGDYEIAPPFLQMERQVVSVPPELREQTKYERLKGTTMNAMSFRSKAERSGWTRAANAAAYRKRFAASAMDGYILLGGMMEFGYDPTATVTFDHVLFLPIDTKEENFTASLMKLGEVPEMVFSETVGDLMRISGKSEAGDAAADTSGEGDDQAPTASQTV